MKPQTAILKLRQRLNKIHSSDYDNIPDWQAVEAINKAALQVTRDIIHGNTKFQEGDEQTSLRVDDMQFLLKPIKLQGSNVNPELFEAKIPTDYIFYKRVIPIASKGECTKQRILSRLVEEANVPIFIQDWSQKPDWDWRETFHTLINNKVRVYTDNQFFIDYIDFVYYRKPIKMDIAGYTHEDSTVSADVDLEFKDDLAEIIIDAAAGILAGDIESINQAQLNAQRPKDSI